MMKIDREIVLQIGKLAHIDLKEEDVDSFAHQLQEILQYVDQLNEVQENADPFSYSFLLQPMTRKDEPLPSLPLEESLRNAPERIKQFFKVPRIIP